MKPECFLSESWRFASEREVKVNEAGPGFIHGENVRPRKGMTCPLFLLIYCLYLWSQLEGANGIYSFDIMWLFSSPAPDLNKHYYFFPSIAEAQQSSTV